MPDFYQYEIIKDLKKNNVKFVLYKNKYMVKTISMDLVTKKDFQYCPNY